MGDTSDLRFDRAEYASGGEAIAPCANCGAPLRDQYWKWQNHVVCDACRARVSETLAKSFTAAAFRKALLQGGGIALGCGIAYAVFVGVTHFQLALATIGIAILVSKQIRKASGGAGGPRFQVLAVALTYFASTMGYLPGIVEAIRDTSSATTQTASAASDSTQPHAQAPAEEHQATGGDTLKALLWLIGIMLAAPFLEITEAPIGVLIVVIGLWQAWKLSRGLPIHIDGPFRVATPATGPPAGAQSAEPPAS
jgi:hypothetical protein